MFSEHLILMCAYRCVYEDLVPHPTALKRPLIDY